MITISAKKISDVTEITKRAITKRAKSENWKFKNVNGQGGNRNEYILEKLPSDIQAAVVASMTPEEITVIPLYKLKPAAVEAASKVLDDTDGNMPAPIASLVEKPSIEDYDTELASRTLKAMHDQRCMRLSRIVHEANEMPQNWSRGRRKWVQQVAQNHNMSWQNVYKLIKKWDEQGAAGMLHVKKSKNSGRKWDPEAIDLWMGICLKREHRKITKAALYDLLIYEAKQRDLSIGSYRSACWWFKQKITPQLLALQKGGKRALDNLLPPVLRDYSDLVPFEMLVGDQHRFDFWVTDDDTGEVFRPEGYFWQDLRTRIIYGGAVARKYDGYLIGLALRIGMRIFGAFGSIYTDNGKPELSTYIMSVMAQMRMHGLYAAPVVDGSGEYDADEEIINPCVILPGTHKKAIVKNAKAKMIEGTFNNVERLLRDRLLIPGYVKRLTDKTEDQDVDQAEIKRLAASGKLLLFSEFASRMFQAMDLYNKEKPHRGVLKEWTARPRPKTATPMDLLKKLVKEGWRPRRLSDTAIDMLFLAKAPRGRIVDRGRVSLFGTFYEHEKLYPLHGQRLDVRYDPIDRESVLVCRDNELICRALPVELSSIKDADLSSRKIEEKRRLLKACTAEYRRMTSDIPDFIRYSDVPQIERDAARIANEKLAEKDLFQEQTEEELEKEVAAIEAAASDFRQTVRKSRPVRPPVFMDKWERYEWCIQYEIAGGILSSEDAQWKTSHEASMTPEQLEYWTTVKEVECGGG